MEHHREKMKMFRSLPGVLPYDVAVLKKTQIMVHFASWIFDHFIELREE